MAKCRKHIGLALLVVYAFFFASANLFCHSHQLSGFKIVHSHPFNGSGHSHTTGQILLIDVLDSATYQESAEISAPELIPVLLGGEIVSPYTSPVFSPEVSSFSLRAPPASC
ncbi:MAG: hypothetical protein MJY50_06600 [Bacteroidales bacterium]|nr:hypothetical protein [Bacteroidales bacterium]